MLLRGAKLHAHTLIGESGRVRFRAYPGPPSFSDESCLLPSRPRNAHHSEQEARSRRLRAHALLRTVGLWPRHPPTTPPLRAQYLHGSAPTQPRASSLLASLAPCPPSMCCRLQGPPSVRGLTSRRRMRVRTRSPSPPRKPAGRRRRSSCGQRGASHFAA